MDLLGATTTTAEMVIPAQQRLLRPGAFGEVHLCVVVDLVEDDNAHLVVAPGSPDLPRAPALGLLAGHRHM